MLLRKLQSLGHDGSMPDDPERTYKGKYRALSYFNSLLIVGACTMFAVFVGKHWEWGPFIVAISIALLGSASQLAVVSTGFSSLGLPAEEQQRLRSRLRVRNAVILPTLLAIGAGCGLIAGSVPSYTLVVFFGLGSLIFLVVLPMLMVFLVKRRFNAQRARASESDS